MQIDIKPGKYVLAISGGVDSMVLLNLAGDLAGLNLVVAHFNHGIRPDAALDGQLVAKIARKYQLPLETGATTLGPNTSEDAARRARYGFLNEVANRYKADKIITAHHQDDLIETAFLNLIRGSGRCGLSAIASNPKILRPLLGISKKEIIEYAEEHQLEWREDLSNSDITFLRNRIRYGLTVNLTLIKRLKLLDNLNKIKQVNHEINNNIAKISQSLGKNQINRLSFSGLPIVIGNEVLAHQLRLMNIRDFDSKTINRLNLAIRTSRAGTYQPVKLTTSLNVGQHWAKFVTT